MPTRDEQTGFVPPEPRVGRGVIRGTPKSFGAVDKGTPRDTQTKADGAAKQADAQAAQEYEASYTTGESEPC